VPTPRAASRPTSALRSGHLLSICCAVFAGFAAEAFDARDAGAQYFTVINNGLAPPNPDNVIDATFAYDVRVVVRNVDCPPESATSEIDPCPSPGAPTRAEIVAGAALGGGSASPTNRLAENAALDSSVITMSGGSVGGLSARDSGRITVTGGYIIVCKAFDDSTITLVDGEVGGYLEARDDATVVVRGGSVGIPGNHGVTTSSSVPVIVSGGSPEVLDEFGAARVVPSYILEGTNFAINGVPADYGDYRDTWGTITGTWASGESFSVLIYATYFRLAPPAVAVPALSMLPALGLAAALLAIGAASIHLRCSA